MSEIENYKNIKVVIFRSISRCLPSKIKKFIKKYLKKKEPHGKLITNQPRERLSPSSTLYPGIGIVDFPKTYEFFNWYYPNCELNSKKWVFDHVRDDWNILDIGANVGIYSVLFGKLARNGKVYALEPTNTFDLLNSNINFHGLTNIDTFQVGLGSQAGFVEEKIFKIWGKPAERSRFAMNTLDEFIFEKGIQQLDFIKVDTDGFELDILEGAQLTLEKFNPYLMIEFSYALNTRGHEVGHLLERLIELGYKNALLLDGNNLVMRKDVSPLNAWSTSLNITPHEYSDLSFFQVQHHEESSVLSNDICVVTAMEFLFQLGSESSPKISDINPLLPKRGPRMEVNDAPLLASVYRFIRSKNHLEIGTWEGFGSALFCANSNGLVTTVNLSVGESHNLNEFEPVYTSSYYPAVREQFTGLPPIHHSDSHDSVGWIYRREGFSNRVKQIFADSRSLSPSNFDSKFESILIDGAHDVESVTSDTKLALNLILPGGVVIWHDFTLLSHERDKYPSTVGVYHAISNCLEEILNSGIKLYWVTGTWLLFGIKSK